MMFAQLNLLPEKDVDAVKRRDLRKYAKYLRHCKDVLWFQWTGEYIKSLQESITSTIRRGPSIKEGDVVLIQ